MEFFELAQQRYSVRKFSDRPVEQEKVEAILRAGQIAPTACNNQPQRIYVIQSKQALETLQKCKFSHFGETLAMLVCANTDECWVRKVDGKNSADVDASIVTTHMMLQAQALGIGSTWVMSFIPEAMKEEFHLPHNEEPIALLVMGYAAEDAAPSERHSQSKDLSETVQYL